MKFQYHVAIAVIALVLLVLLVPFAVTAAPGSGARFLQDTGDCYQNCTANVRTAGTLFVVSRDAQGDIFQVDHVRLSPDAELIDSRRQIESGARIQSSSDGGTVDVSTETYETTTEIVVVTTYAYYNADGDLVDVQIRETRFKKELDTQ